MPARLYSAFGLTLRSDIALPGLLPGKGPADATVRMDRASSCPAEGPRGTYWSAGGSRARHVSPDFGIFRIHRGREILITPKPRIGTSLLGAYVMGPVIRHLLHQRGYLVLHASAVGIPGGAAAFLGASGWGKSTTAAALHAHGCAFLSDEHTAIRMGSDPPLVIPAYPQIRLKPDAVRALGRSGKRSAGGSKLLLRASRGFLTKEVPLKRLYVLAEGPRVEITPLPPAEGFIELLRHSACLSFIMQMGAMARFSTYTALAQRIGVSRLERPKSLKALPEIVRTLVADWGIHATVEMKQCT